ncbi:MAG: hypothetical protein IJ794_09175 [Lachnospiraceae bacterium]|nr:hypothetical protein [Lachnospiraceae bacterium]
MTGGMMTGKRRFSLFWCFYVFFVIAMVLFWFAVGEYVKNGLVQFEESQPANTMDKLLASFEQEGFDQYLTVGELSRYETAEEYAKVFAGMMAGKTLSYALTKGYQDPAAPQYEIYADGEPIGTVVLKEVSAKPLLKLLTISEWEPEQVEIAALPADHVVEIAAPVGYQVCLNGIPAEERDKAGTGEIPEEFTYASAYVKVPAFETYRVEGLIGSPRITAYDQTGKGVLVEREEGDKVIRAKVAAFTESEMPGELSAMALDHVERYTNFFSGDLPGCHSSVAPLKDMFPADSYYLEMAETYRREDMWMYSDHDTPRFKDEVVGHYIWYNEELFSCEVSFTKEMLLTKWNSMREDKVNFKLYYGLVDGAWKIVDMQTLLDET